MYYLLARLARSAGLAGSLARLAGGLARLSAWSTRFAGGLAWLSAWSAGSLARLSAWSAGSLAGFLMRHLSYDALVSLCGSDASG